MSILLLVSIFMKMSAVEELVARTVYFGCAIFIFFTVSILAIVADVIQKLFFKSEAMSHGKAVFITGCDTGFGNALAKRLDSKGFHVFATCLFPTGAGASGLKDACSNRLHVLHMDVTKDESVQKAVDYVKENLRSSGLEFWALVNNAGIIKGFSVDCSSVDDFRDCMEVNFVGCVRVTKAFLPLLKQTKGRIVNITSAAGELSLPFFTPYSASKYAAVGFTDCLRHEVGPSGISVVSVEPELFLTGLTSPDILHKNLDAKLRGSCQEDFAASFKDIARLFLSFACPKISLVVDDLEAAVSLVHPHHTYKPRRHLLARFVCFSYEVMPRSGQILLMKLAFFVFFSESKAIKNFVIKIVSLV